MKKQKKDDAKKDHRSNKECYNCGKLGHFANQCYSKKKEKAHVSLEEDLNEDHMLFSASEASTIVMEGVWLVDSGATNHMTNEENYFSRLDRSIKVPIEIGNGGTVMTAGKGDITVMTKGGKRTIRNVFLVPGLAKNLLSVPQIVSSGYRVKFQEKRCIIEDEKGRRIMDIPMTHKSYRIRMSSAQVEETMSASEQGKMETWHKRLGHVGNKRLQKMHDKYLVKGLPKFKVKKEACVVCRLGKQSRKSFPKECGSRNLHCQFLFK